LEANGANSLDVVIEPNQNVINGNSSTGFVENGKEDAMS
jgi:hypothetical protein